MVAKEEKARGEKQETRNKERIDIK